MKLSRKAAVAIAASLFLGAGISTVPVLGDCQWGSVGNCSLTPSSAVLIGWDIESTRVATDIGPLTFSINWDPSVRN